MKNLKCLIIDDETLAQELIASHVDKVPFLEVVGTCSSAVEAYEQLSMSTVDVLFLDVEMPNLNGLDFLASLSVKPQVILTTAYSEFALKAFDLNVVDYLLKPITFERFFTAVQKLDRGDMAPQNESSSQVSSEKIFVKSDYKIEGISVDEILFIESVQKYVKFYHGDSVTMTLMSLKKVLEILPSSVFIKVHKSYIVQHSKIDRIDGNTLYVGSYEVPISKSMRKEVLNAIDSHGLL